MRLFLLSLLFYLIPCTCVRAHNVEASTEPTLWHEGLFNRKLLQSDTLPALFEQLNDPNESKALEAYAALTAYSSSELRIFIRSLKRNYFESVNEVVPKYAKSRLLFLAKLTEYCLAREISIVPPDDLMQLLVKIDTTVNSIDRRRLSQKLLGSINIENVSALERSAFIHHRQMPEASYALSWALNYWYEENWPSIAADSLQLDLYINKAGWYWGLGSGNTRTFGRRLKTGGAKVREMVEQIMRQSDRRGSKLYLREVLSRSDTTKGTIPVRIFMDRLANGLETDINRVEIDSSIAVFAEIFEILAQKKRKVASNVLRYLPKISHPGITPYLLKVMNDDRIVFRGGRTTTGRTKNAQGGQNVVTAGDIAITFLEGIHLHAFQGPSEQEKRIAVPLDISFYEHLMTGRHKTGPQWQRHYEDAGGNVQEWAAFFQQQRINELLLADTVSIDQINGILRSIHLEPDNYPEVLDALVKVYPRNDLLRLILPPDLFLNAKQFPLFENLKFRQNALPRVVRLFKTTEPEVLYPFMQKLAREFQVREQNDFFGKKLGYAWLRLLEDKDAEWLVLNDALPAHAIESIVEHLNEFLIFLNSTDTPSQRTRNLICKLTLTDLSLKEKLAIIASDTSGTYQKYLGHLINNATYAELPLFLEFYSQLNLRVDLWERILRRGWGLPVPTPLTPEIITDLKERVEQQPEETVRKYYLELLGLEVPEDNDELKTLQRLETIRQFVPGGNIGVGRTLDDVAIALGKFRKSAD